MPNKEFRLKGSERILSMISAFSATEKVVFGFLILIAIVSSLTLAWKVNRSFLVPIPAHGGSFSEGIVGLPRSVNPVLAFTDVDKDLSNIIYSGLMKYEDGKLIPDLAKEYTISDDGLVYAFTLREDLRFHDGTPLTTNDVEFTIRKIQDGDIKSPRRADWSSVTISKISSTEIHFILKQPYAPFLTNTTIGIIPEHIWKNLDPDQFVFSNQNIEPIGSGPYKIDKVTKDKDGIPLSYNLSSFNKYHTGKPYISKIDIYFYSNEEEALDAHKGGIVDNIAGISPSKLSDLETTSKNSTVLTSPLPRIFGVFLNQNNSPVLANKEVRQALDISLNKERIIDEVLHGYGVSMNSPLPFGILNKEEVTQEGDKERAKEILSDKGWIINADGILSKKTNTGSQTLEFSIATTDSPDLKRAAEIIKEEWESIGASVTIKVFEYGDLSQNIIKTRKYDALLFGEVIGKDVDLYAFWHSSQRNSPGLNVAMYVNSKTDSLLEKIRTAFDDEERRNLYEDFEEAVQEDVPAVFLYSPEYAYVISKDINGYDMPSITSPSDRFYGIDKWYKATDYVWRIFIEEKENE